MWKDEIEIILDWKSYKCEKTKLPSNPKGLFPEKTVQKNGIIKWTKIDYKYTDSCPSENWVRRGGCLCKNKWSYWIPCSRGRWAWLSVSSCDDQRIHFLECKGSRLKGLAAEAQINQRIKKIYLTDYSYKFYSRNYHM